MPSVMHTADHSHKMRKICSDAQLINDGGSVNMYIVPSFFDVWRNLSRMFGILNNSKYLCAMNNHRCPNLEEFKEILHKHSLKATPQRLAVHEAMIELGHASADMVTEVIKAKGTAKVTLASVYNILTQMAMLKVYNYRLSANNKMYFDVNTFKHIHLYDHENHVFKDVVDDELVALIESHLGRKRVKGYKIESIDIQLVARPSKKKYLA